MRLFLMFSLTLSCFLGFAPAGQAQVPLRQGLSHWVVLTENPQVRTSFDTTRVVRIDSTYFVSVRVDYAHEWPKVPGSTGPFVATEIDERVNCDQQLVLDGNMRLIAANGLPVADSMSGSPTWRGFAEHPLTPALFIRLCASLEAMLPGPGAATVHGDVFLAQDLDTPPRLQVSHARYYPKNQLNQSGRVTIRFVVDTIGLPEPASIRFVHAPDSAFAEAARLTVLAQEYEPGATRGQKVRTLLDYEVRFKPNGTSCSLAIVSRGVALCADSLNAGH
jgi:hypothetical protein